VALRKSGSLWAHPMPAVHATQKQPHKTLRHASACCKPVVMVCFEQSVLDAHATCKIVSCCYCISSPCLALLIRHMQQQPPHLMHATVSTHAHGSLHQPAKPSMMRRRSALCAFCGLVQAMHVEVRPPWHPLSRPPPPPTPHPHHRRNYCSPPPPHRRPSCSFQNHNFKYVALLFHHVRAQSPANHAGIMWPHSSMHPLATPMYVSCTQDAQQQMQVHVLNISCVFFSNASQQGTHHSLLHALAADAPTAAAWRV
jgi:hypothetical protein